MNRREEIEARLAAIAAELEQDGADLDALENEVRSLRAELNQITTAAERRAALRQEVAGGAGTVVRSFEQPNHQPTYGPDSPEYRTAWLKSIAVDAQGRHLFGSLTNEERAAFTFTTSNTGTVVPTEIMNRIIELVDNDSPLYDDAQKSNMVSGFEIPRHKSIKAGDAAVTNEGAANEDEEDAFDYISLPGVEIKKHIVMSRKMQFQSIKAFEDWVVTHLAERVRVAKEKYILGQLDKSATVGIAASNVIEGTVCNDAELRRALALLHGSGNRVLYANSNFIWSTLAGIENAKGEKLFIPNAMADPIIEGRIYGTAVKKDANIPDDSFLIGYPNQILVNEFILFDITPQIEAKTLNRIFVGYALVDAGLMDPQSFVKWKKKAATGG